MNAQIIIERDQQDLFYYIAGAPDRQTGRDDRQWRRY
jgi:hypothetical protein